MTLRKGKLRPITAALAFGAAALAAVAWAMAQDTAPPASQAAQRPLKLAAQVDIPVGSWLVSGSFSPDARYYATGGKNGLLQVWSTSDGKKVAALEHEGAVEAVAFSRSGKELVTADGTGVLRLVDTATWKVRQEIEPQKGIIRHVALSPNGKKLLCATVNKKGVLLDLTGKGAVWQSDSHIMDSAWSPDGLFVVTAYGGRAVGEGVDRTYRDCVLRIWDATKSAMLSPKPQAPLKTFEGHTKPVVAVDVSRNGEQILSGSIDGTVRLWSADRGELIRILAKDQGSYVDVAFWADSSRAIWSYSPDKGRNYSLRFCDVSGQGEISITPTKTVVYQIGLSADGRQIVTAHLNGVDRVTLCTWELLPPAAASAPAK